MRERGREGETGVRFFFDWLIHIYFLQLGCSIEIKVKRGDAINRTPFKEAPLAYIYLRESWAHIFCKVMFVTLLEKVFLFTCFREIKKVVEKMVLSYAWKEPHSSLRYFMLLIFSFTGWDGLRTLLKKKKKISFKGIWLRYFMRSPLNFLPPWCFFHEFQGFL